MGLDFSHCSAMWSYSGFNEFRERLLKETHYTWADIATDKSTDVLFVLLNHSNCEGYIESSDCLPLAERLSSIVKLWPPDDWDRHEALQLVKGLRLAAGNGEKLEFR